jgi:GT2 family glycosyltransferase
VLVEKRSAKSTEPKLRRPGEEPHVVAWSFLSQDVALLLGSFPCPSRGRLQAWLTADGKRTKLQPSVLPFGPNDKSDEEARTVVVLRLPPERDRLLREGLVLKSSGLEISVGPTDLAESLLPLDSLLKHHVSGAQAPARASLLDRLLPVAAGGSRHRVDLAESLRTARDALRAPLPSGGVERRNSCSARADAIWRIDDSAYYVEGWLHHDEGELSRLTVVTPEGRSVELAKGAFRYARPDVAEFLELSPTKRLGFIAYFETPEPSLLASGWILEVRLSDGTAMESEMPPVVCDLGTVRSTILGDLMLERLPEDRLRRHHIRPALERVQARLTDGLAIETVDQHGTPPREPEVSIVVPLYRRVEFLEQQLAQFVHDPEISQADLVYVLDSPGDADYLRPFAAQLFRLYGVPFRLAVLTKNGGFSAVNNLGASIARGRLLLLLNSDVLPSGPGWLSKMIAFYDSTPNVGALAPKLLYEDDSIQHAGLYFDRPPGSHVWSNEHYFKGLYYNLPAANVSRAMPAVTGACMMIAATLYRQLGGLRGRYIQGDYEDSDLCLRLRDMGHESWYFPDVELYHLEGQSYLSTERQLTSEYNKWLHTSIWDEAIAGIMEAHEAR